MSQARRYTPSEKSLCALLWKASPKQYNTVLTNEFQFLPSEKTLKTLLYKLPMRPGIISFVLESLEEFLRNSPNELEQYIALSVDEINIQEHLYVDTKNQYLGGFVDYGCIKSTEDNMATSSRTYEISNHALNILVTGLFSGKTAPIYYGFTRGAIAGADLQEVLVLVCNALKTAGYDVKVIVSDQNSNNTKALNLLAKESSPEKYKDGYNGNVHPSLINVKYFLILVYQNYVMYV